MCAAAHSEILDWISNEDPKIKGEAEDKLKAAVDDFAKGFDTGVEDAA